MKSHPPLQPDDTYKDEYDFIETYTGIHFFPYAPEPQFNILDIAHALSLCARYNGHTKKFYSVAEHSVLVSNIMEGSQLPGNPLEGLMHDATEAYLTDVPAPFKQHLPDWRDFDTMLEGKLREWMQFPTQRPASVKTADWLALFIEANALLPSGGDCFADPEGLRPKALEMAVDYPILCLTPKEGEHAFLMRYQQIIHKVAMQRQTYGPNL